MRYPPSAQAQPTVYAMLGTQTGKDPCRQGAQPSNSDGSSAQYVLVTVREPRRPYVPVVEHAFSQQQTGSMGMSMSSYLP